MQSHVTISGAVMRKLLSSKCQLVRGVRLL